MAWLRHNHADDPLPWVPAGVSFAASPLFALVPPGLFGPLAGVNRERYWALLCRLFDEFFGPDAPLPPSLGFARRDLTAAIERYLINDDPWLDEDDEGNPPGAALVDRANAIHERFRASGWLRQERVGAREMVSMVPAVAQLLATLVEFAERGPTFVSAKVRSIELQLQQVIEGKAAGDALDEAAEQARRLLVSLSSMSLKVRDLMPELTRAESTAQFARQWFERYVSSFFVGDYAELHNTDHPLARRGAILAMAREVAGGARREAMLAWYAEHLTGGDRAQAELRLARSLRRLNELERIDEYLGRLDDDIRAANRRALAFLDYRLRVPDKLDVLLRRACDGAQCAPAEALRAAVAPDALMDEDRLRAPRRRPSAIARSANATQQPTPEQRARLVLLRRMKRTRSITAEDMAQYLARQLPAHGRVESAQLHIDSIADLRAWQTLLTLALRSRRVGGLRRDDPLQRLACGVRVQLLESGARDDNGYLRAPRFAIERIRRQA